MYRAIYNSNCGSYNTRVWLQYFLYSMPTINVVKKASWLLKSYDFTSQHVSNMSNRIKTRKLVKSVKLDQTRSNSVKSVKSDRFYEFEKHIKLCILASNMYLNIFIVLNLCLAKLVQFHNQELDFDYNYYNFFNDTSCLWISFP